MLLSLFSKPETNTSAQAQASSFDLNSIISSMPTLLALKSPIREEIRVEDLLDLSKELDEQKKVAALARKAKEQRDALKKGQNKKPKNEEDLSAGRASRDRKSPKKQFKSKVSYKDTRNERTEDAASEISYEDNIDYDDDFVIKKKDDGAHSEAETNDLDSKKTKNLETPKSNYLMPGGQALSSRSTDPSGCPSPIVSSQGSTKHLSVKSGNVEKENKSSYFQKLQRHNEASKDCFSNAKKTSDMKRISKESHSKMDKRNNDGKRPLEKPISKDEPKLMKKSLVENHNRVSIKAKEKDDRSVKHSKMSKYKPSRYEEEDDEHDSFIDDAEYEQNADCEEMESYKRMLSSYRKKIEMRKHLERDINNMEARFEDLQKEDRRTAIIGKMEDDVELVAINRERKTEREQRLNKSKRN